MGTRGLTVVVQDGKHVVAQYGQWDHYPSGQGVDILNFCKTWLNGDEKTSQFLSNLAVVRFVNDTDVNESKAFAESLGSTNGWVTLEQSKKFDQQYPYWSRDVGGKILEAIADPLPGCPLVLQDDYAFAADSLFCEWAYVVDLDAGNLDVYKGWNKTGSAKGRFADLKNTDEHRNKQYGPVSLVASFPLSNLPDKDVFVESFKKLEDE